MIINNQTFTGSFKAFGFAAPFIYHLKITNNHVNMQDIVLNVSFLFKQTFFYLLNCGKLSTDPSRLNSFQNSFCNPNLLSLKNSKVQLARIYFKCSPSSSRQLSSLVPSSALLLPFSSEAAALLNIVIIPRTTVSELQKLHGRAYPKLLLPLRSHEALFGFFAGGLSFQPSSHLGLLPVDVGHLAGEKDLSSR